MAKDKFDRDWITENALEEIENYEPGVLTLRALHYRLVSRGMTNSVQHYKRVVAAMTKARWNGQVSFDTFSDHDRGLLGDTEYEPTSVSEATSRAENQIRLWMTSYSKNDWENQEYYIEVWIEKKALQGTFLPICDKHKVSLAPCKGYPSLTFLDDARARFQRAKETHKVKILYFGDYDPSGENIPDTIRENLRNLGVDVEVDRRLLLGHQVKEWGLPPAPAKKTDSRTANWDGVGQVELDAIEPKKLQSIVEEAILEHRDSDLYDELQKQESEEREEFVTNLKEYVKGL